MDKDASCAIYGHYDYCKLEDITYSKLATLPEKPRLLLHACCGPCSTSCVERLADEYQITVYYYNPNITDREEYFVRRDTLLQFLDAFNAENKDRGIFVDYLEGRYEPAKYLSVTAELAAEPERGARCDVCYNLRMTDTAIMARKLEMDYFTTTLSVSPHKNYQLIADIGYRLEDEVGVNFLDIDFKKKNGFGRSIELSRKYGLYRQNFCGCDYARPKSADYKNN